mgnify:CR=1 FL=1
MDQPKVKLLKLNIRLVVVAIVLGVVVAVALYMVQYLSVPKVIKPSHPFLGITYSSTSEGAYIQKVTAGSAAEKAGIRAGDIVTRVDGENVDSISKISQTVAAKKVSWLMDVGRVEVIQ